jgi:hypothetical protein
VPAPPAAASAATRPTAPTHARTRAAHCGPLCPETPPLG